MKVSLKLDKFEFKGVSTERPLIMAGPCSAETEEQVMDTARQLKELWHTDIQGRTLETAYPSQCI